MGNSPLTAEGMSDRWSGTRPAEIKAMDKAKKTKTIRTVCIAND